jgi:hypothetical protein
VLAFDRGSGALLQDVAVAGVSALGGLALAEPSYYGHGVLLSTFLHMAGGLSLGPAGALWAVDMGAGRVGQLLVP